MYVYIYNIHTHGIQCVPDYSWCDLYCAQSSLKVELWSYLRSDTCLHAERIGNSPSRLRSACSACLMLKFHEPKTVIENI